jgi:hypothetical protein
MQYLSEEELSALIMAMHQISQRQLPVVLIGAGLPQLVALAGRSKSYAERFNPPMPSRHYKSLLRIRVSDSVMRRWRKSCGKPRGIPIFSRSGATRPGTWRRRRPSASMLYVRRPASGVSGLRPIASRLIELHHRFM